MGVSSESAVASSVDRRSRRWLFVGVFLAMWGLITHSTFAGSGDEPHYQMIAHSLVFDGDLDLANNYDDPNNLVFGGGLEPEGHAIAGAAGTLRPVHDIGLPLLFAPYFALSYAIAHGPELLLPKTWLAKAKLNTALMLRQLLSLGMIAIAGWIALQLFDVFSRETPSRAAVGWAALLVLSPPILSHAFLLFPEIPSAAIALWVFRSLRRDTVRVDKAMWLGLATGGLLLLHARNAGLLVGLSVLAVVRARQLPEGRRVLAWFITGASVALAVRTTVNYVFWGTLLTTPHASLQWPAWSDLTQIWIRLSGWTLDQEHGLLPYAPIYLLAPAGWVALWRVNRDLCLQLTLVVSAYVALIALPFVNTHGWRGGWSPAARFIGPVAPFLAVLVVAGARSKPWTGWPVRALVVLQICLSALLWQYPKLLWNDGDGTSALLSYLDRESGYLSRAFPSLTEPVHVTTVISVAIVATVLLVSMLSAMKGSRPAIAATPGQATRFHRSR